MVIIEECIEGMLQLFGGRGGWIFKAEEKKAYKGEALQHCI